MDTWFRDIVFLYIRFHTFVILFLYGSKIWPINKHYIFFSFIITKCPSNSLYYSSLKVQRCSKEYRVNGWDVNSSRHFSRCSDDNVFWSYSNIFCNPIIVTFFVCGSIEKSNTKSLLLKSFSISLRFFDSFGKDKNTLSFFIELFDNCYLIV